MLGVKLERYIKTKSISTLVSSSTIIDRNLTIIRDWHKEKNCQLFVIDERKFNNLALNCQIKDEYLDFFLVDGEVIFGFMNDNKNFKTIIASDKYILYVKDSKAELKNYKKFVVELKKIATEVTNLS